jgi:SNF2 family DNA or RNA helicase
MVISGLRKLMKREESCKRSSKHHKQLLRSSRYANLITGSSQSSEPPESKGGLLADKMGLGKSLTMISLIALNPTLCKEPLIFTSQGSIRRVKSTLVVVPYSCRTPRPVVGK